MEAKMAADKEQKMKIIEDAIVSIEKTYGKGSIMKLEMELLMILKLFQQVHFHLIMHLVSEEFQEEELLKFMVRNQVEKQLFVYM